MICPRDFVLNQAAEIPEYFVYCGIFAVQSQCKRSGQIANRLFLGIAKIKKRLKNYFLRRVKTIPAVPLKLQPMLPLQAPTSPIP